MTESKTRDVSYLLPEDFFEKYPLGKGLNAGTSGEVYRSGDVYVVKKFTGDDSMLDLSKELNIYSSYIHPCILKPRGWTVKKNIAYLAMDKGEDIRYAFDNGKITIEQIVSDTLSAVAFLNSQGIVHGDIKPDNMIYHDNKAKLIDMGLARKAKLSSDGDYYIRGELYSSPYIDIEYRDDQENNIKCEIYALAMSYLAIMTSKFPEFGDISVRDNVNKTGINWLLKRAAKLQKDRPSIKTLLEIAPTDLIVRTYNTTIFHEPLIKQGSDCDTKLGFIMNHTVKVLYEHNYRAETLFLALHLLHRIYYPLLKKYKDDGVTHHLHIIMVATIILAGSATNESGLEIRDWIKRDSDMREELYNTMTDILIISEGVISTLTYWDYAMSKDDLFLLLQDIISCRYNPTLIREVTKGTDKCVTIKEMISGKQIKQFDIAKTTEQMWESSTLATFPVQVVPCSVEIGGSSKKIEGYWKSAKVNLNKDDFEGTETFYSVILHNRDQLSNLDLDTALKIYEAFLKGGKPLDDFVLDIICEVDWRDLGESVIVEKIFPF